MYHIVYVLENKNDASWYVGQTENLKRRLGEHNSGTGGRTTRIKTGLWKLIYAESYCDKRDALGREKFLKGGSGRKYLYKQLVHYLENTGSRLKHENEE
ncbi:MAG: GIY-YIG nuclease family protein [Minisyncoccia bacterium]